MLNRPVHGAMLLALGLIWLAQLAFTPIMNSLLFACVIISLAWQYHKNLHKKQSKIFQVIFVLLSFAAIYWQYRSFIGVEAGVTLLAVGLYGKALETRTRRDYLIIFNFALFVSASLFLYSQNIGMAILILCSLISCLIGLYRIQISEFKQEQVKGRLRKDFQHVTKLILYAIPFFIVLFIFSPRLPPLWSVPLQTDRATTGISDRMSPGDIAQISQSSALAFRILGNIQKLPEREQLYWRAMVLDEFDGRTWTSHFINQQPKTLPSLHITDGLDYQYLPADSQQQWVVSLEKSIPLQANFQLHQDWSITPTRPNQGAQPIRLQWLGQSAQTVAPQYSDTVQAINLKVPSSTNPRTRQLASNLFKQSNQQPARYVENVLNWYRRNGFVYTLSPGRLGQDRIDEFLFKSRQGFCEHYAGSFTMLMRYAGIPARVVVGYQGGQPAPDGQSWEVRQMDAHAWSEFYLNGQWHRVDATAAVAPERVGSGMQDYLEQEPSTLGNNHRSGLQYQQFALLKNIRVWSDYASYQWQSKVVGYDTDKQKNWLARLGLKSVYSYILILFISIVMLVLIYLLIQYRQNLQKMTPYERSIRKFTKNLPVELHKYSYETFQQWMIRLAQYSNDTSSFYELAQLDQKIRFMQQDTPENLKMFKKLLKDCAFALKLNKKNLSEK